MLILNVEQTSFGWNYNITWNGEHFTKGTKFPTYDDAWHAGEIALSFSQEIVQEHDELNAPSLPC